ncbi:MAG: hypothetical protein WC444_05760 [Candidatus Paceibacterota bacterium]
MENQTIKVNINSLTKIVDLILDEMSTYGDMYLGIDISLSDYTNIQTICEELRQEIISTQLKQELEIDNTTLADGLELPQFTCKGSGEIISVYYKGITYTYDQWKTFLQQNPSESLKIHEKRKQL